MRKQRLHIPKFKREDQERAFWSRVNLADHLSPKDFSRVSFPNLKPSSRSISIRIPEYLLVRIKEQANELHIPYQTLIKQFIAQKVLQNK